MPVITHHDLPPVFFDATNKFNYVHVFTYCMCTASLYEYKCEVSWSLLREEMAYQSWDYKNGRLGRVFHAARQSIGLISKPVVVGVLEGRIPLQIFVACYISTTLNHCIT